MASAISGMMVIHESLVVSGLFSLYLATRVEVIGEESLKIYIVSEIDGPVRKMVLIMIIIII